jgi:hypothetical protein
MGMGKGRKEGGGEGKGMGIRVVGPRAMDGNGGKGRRLGKRTGNKGGSKERKEGGREDKAGWMVREAVAAMVVPAQQNETMRKSAAATGVSAEQRRKLG